MTRLKVWVWNGINIEIIENICR